VAQEAVVVNATRQHTVASDAFLVEGALRVGFAAGYTTSFLAELRDSVRSSVEALVVASAGCRYADALVGSVTGETGRAGADALVSGGSADGIHSASTSQARIDTATVYASLGIGAFHVRLAGRFAASTVAEGVWWAVRFGLTSDALANTSSTLFHESLTADAARFAIGCRLAVCIGSAILCSAHVLAFRLAAFSFTADG